MSVHLAECPTADDYVRTRERSTVIPPIRITAIIDGDAASALPALACVAQPGENPPHESHTVWFAEGDPDAAGCPLPLFSNNLVLRLRSGSAEDVSVQVKPDIGAVFGDRWRQSFTEGDFSYRVTGDWCGDRRRLTAAATSRRPAGTVAAALADGAQPAHLLDHLQRQFIVSCTPGGVPMDRLAPLGPVMSTTWHTQVSGVSVAIDRMQAGDLDLVELSTHLRAWPDEAADEFARRAADRHSAMYDAIERFGLSASTGEATSTERVLTSLRSTL